MPETPQTRPALRFAGAILGLLALAPLIEAADSPSLRVVFGPRNTVLSGRVDAETTVEALVAALQSARPDLPPDRSGLDVDPAAEKTNLADLKSLLAEIALSTHEGRLEIWPDRLVIGGLTDSLVTQSALRIRAEPFLRNRILQNRLCIVSTDDLPDIAVSLADGSKVAMEVAPSATTAPKVETPFEAPGLRLEKLLAALSLLADPSKLGAPPAVPPATLPAPAGPMRAEPVAEGATAPTIPLTATPVETLEPLSPVSFSANSFLLQANQTAILDAIAKHLLSPARAGFTVRLEAMKPSGGSSTYNDYLCERRAAEVSRLLAERGVNPALLQPDTVDSRSPIDSGEVRVTVVIPPLPSGAPAATAPGNGTPTQPPPAAPPAP
jgi:outer membrane protein OmpA-like peptidoglycan-associated protein